MEETKQDNQQEQVRCTADPMGEIQSAEWGTAKHGCADPEFHQAVRWEQ